MREGYYHFYFIDGETEADSCSDLPKIIKLVGRGWSWDLNLGGPALATDLLTSVFCYLRRIVMTVVVTAVIY